MAKGLSRPGNGEDGMSVFSREILEYHVLSPRTYEDNPAGCIGGTQEPGPGLRGDNQIVVYDKEYGQPSTGTNCWGAELPVDRFGRILAVIGGDSAIPEGGMVISGVGEPIVRRLLEIEPFGKKVTLNREKRQILLECTPESLLSYSQLVIEQLEAELAQCRSGLLDIDYETAEEKLTEAKEALRHLESLPENAGEAELKAAADQVRKAGADGHLACQPGLRVEKRAVWYRAVEKNEAEVEETLRYARDAGLTAVYLEAWIEGHSLWPSDIPDIEMWPDLEGFDALGAFIRIGHRLGLEIHAWCEPFLIGVIPHSKSGKPGSMERYAPLAKTHPDWLLESRLGCRYSNRVFDHMDMYFFNPMEEGARDLVASVYREMVTRYELDGVNFDYVRFPEPNDPQDGKMDDFGFNRNIVEAYQAKFGTDPHEITDRPPQWRQWSHFRAELINTFVYRTADEVRKINPKLNLSVSIFANYDLAMTLKYQETMDWVSKGYIDEVFTMSYYMDERPVISETRDTIRRAGDMAYASTGIAAYVQVSEETILRQLKGIREENAAGSAFFALLEFRKKGFGKLLRSSLYRDDAIASPDRVEQAVPAILEEMLRKIREIYMPFAGGAEEDYAVPRLETALAAARNNRYDEAGSRALLGDTQALLTALDGLTINGNACNHLRSDLDRTAYLLRVHLNRLASRGGR